MKFVLLSINEGAGEMVVAVIHSNHFKHPAEKNKQIISYIVIICLYKQYSNSGDMALRDYAVCVTGQT